MSLYQLTAHELHEKLKAREITSAELTQSVFDRIDAVEGQIEGYITLTKETAFQQAEAADVGFQRGDEMPPLAGIPIAIKDVICTKGILTTCGSKILGNFVPPYDATVTTKLHQQGSVVIGKTNMDEFAMGSSTENSAYRITRNPWDLDTIPGGSSGGSAAVVAADEAICSLGSDTGGSIRQPAALCGVVGMKPTYGRVSRFGLVAFASSLDQIGPFTKDVTDCALMLNAICGHDPMDSTSVSLPTPDYTEYLTNDLEGIKIGVPKEYFIDGMDTEVEGIIHAAVEALKECGASIEEISLPHTEYAIATYYIIARRRRARTLRDMTASDTDTAPRKPTNLLRCTRKPAAAGSEMRSSDA